MPNNQTDPETDAMLDGAEIERGAAEGAEVAHTPQTHPVDRPPKHDGSHEPLLTTDTEAQQDDSVINPETA